jgi:hypothetical protein
MPFIPCLRLQLGCMALTTITGLPVYHGALWSALLRNLLRRYFPARTSLADTGILPVCRWNPQIIQAGHTLYLELLTPVSCLHPVLEMLWDFNYRHTRGYFRPGVTLRLQTVHCAVSGTLIVSFDSNSPPVLHSDNLVPLTPESLALPAATLLQQSAFTLVFDTPLRLRRPPGKKTPGHQFCDTKYFRDITNTDAIAHLASGVRWLEPVNDGRLHGDTAATIDRSTLTWMDIPYGRGFPKTLGGVTGHITVQGITNREMARRLVWGQFTGAGKNGAFGLGFYHIPELNEPSFHSSERYFST